ncbi:MAG: hypothetical protein P8J89_07635 [Phycisphaerales bacterium]|nr:hypothetical protein [Phycisphaerales bacterium]
MNLRNLALLAATSLSWLATAAMVRSQPIVISEFMAKNDLTLEDEDGDSPDWIELCNIATSVIDLDGWSLTDDQDELDKWISPPTPPGAGAVPHRLRLEQGSNRSISTVAYELQALHGWGIPRADRSLRNRHS